MRYPEFLKKGETLGFIAPSFGCAIEPYRSAFQNSLKKWESLGYRALLGPNCYEGQGVGISNTPQACGAEVNDFFLHQPVQAILSCGGGELMCEILDHVDFEAIGKAHPKWFMGYSDNTNLTFLLTTLCNQASIYGPCAPAFGMEPWHPSLKDAHGLLTGGKWTVESYDKWEKESLKDENHPLEPYHVTEENRVLAFPQQDAAFSGRLLGGCMDCLVNLTGTRFDKVEEFCHTYRQDGILWFLESCDLNVFAIRRALWQMKEAGWFRYAKGFLIGRPGVHGQQMMGLDQYQAVTEVLQEFSVPVILDADIGHLPPMMPLVCGALAQAEYRGGKLSLRMKRG